MNESELGRRREIERRLTSITQHAPDYILELNRAGHITYMNRPAPGFTMEQMINRDVRTLMHPSAHTDFEQCLDRVFETGELASYESKGGVTGRDYINRINAVYEDGEVIGAILITHDITELKRAEQKTRDMERRLRAITEHAPDFIMELDRAGTITYLNRETPNNRRSEIVGTDARKWFEKDAHGAFDLTLARVFETGEVLSYESVSAVTGRTYVNRVSPVFEHENVVSAILITHDITERKAAEDALRESSERYKTLLEASFEGLMLSVNQKIVFANEAMARIFGGTVEDLIGLGPLDLASPETASRVIDQIKSGRETPYEITAVRKDGSLFPAELLGRNTTFEGQPARITGVRDLSERQRREERERHAQKLETLGILAGGVAHDFNNMLAVMLANADLGLLHTHDAQRITRCFEQIRSAALRARDLTRQLLTYAGRGDRSLERVQLSDLLREITELLRTSISKKASLKLSLEKHLPLIEVDSGQMQQVAMNLIINASEALGPSGGTIHLSTGTMHVDADYLADSFGDLDLEEGDYVYMEIGDDGSGMSTATVGRIFDPFFTTKGAGRGLGLAALQGIVRAHHGAIKVETEPEQGTTFRVLLPAAGPTENRRSKRTAGRSLPTEATTVLLAEDDRSLSQALRSILESEGFKVETAADGVQATQMFAAKPTAYGLILLDITMPKMDGIEVLGYVRQRCKDIPVVLMSGYAEHSVSPLLAEDEKLSFLMKPYEMETLLDAVATALTKSSDHG